MGTDNILFLESLEWFDETGQAFVYRLPEHGSGEIKFGAQLTVRDSQAAVFFYKGKAVGVFGSGRHTLKTGNIPLLTKIASLPWAFNSPLRAEVYFTNLKTFTNLKWGTRDPVAFKDTELGLVRLRAFGVFNVQIVQPVLFINQLVGTRGIYTTREISDYLNQVVVSKFNDYMGEKIKTIFDLPAEYDELGKGLALRIRDDFNRFGLAVKGLYINAITPPPEVQSAIDDKSRMAVFDGMNRLMQLKTAMAMEKISDQPDGAAGTGAGTGMGMGMGLMMPAMFAQQLSDSNKQLVSPKRKEGAATCPECENAISVDAKFCPQCGHQQVIFEKCEACGKNLTPGANFCSRCGNRVQNKKESKFCTHCGAPSLSDSVFCNNCGEKH